MFSIMKKAGNLVRISSQPKNCGQKCARSKTPSLRSTFTWIFSETFCFQRWDFFLNYTSDMKIPKCVNRDVKGCILSNPEIYLIAVKRTSKPSLWQHLSQYCTDQTPTNPRGWTDHPLDRFTSAQYRTESPAVLDDETPVPRKTLVRCRHQRCFRRNR